MKGFENGYYFGFPPYITTEVETLKAQFLPLVASPVNRDFADKVINTFTLAVLTEPYFGAQAKAKVKNLSDNQLPSIVRMTTAPAKARKILQELRRKCKAAQRDVEVKMFIEGVNTSDLKAGGYISLLGNEENG